MGYEDQPSRRRTLTPLESELRATTRSTEPLRQTKPPGPWRRLRRWRAGRRPPRTLAGAIALGLVRLAVGLATGSGLALLLARWMDRPAAIGFYLVGAVILLSAMVGARAGRQRMVYEYTEAGRPVRAAPGLTLAAVGLLLIVAGAILETVGA
jgi:hypothetical protein